jgi:hypothetical protein
LDEHFCGYKNHIGRAFAMPQPLVFVKIFLHLQKLQQPIHALKVSDGFHNFKRWKMVKMA